MVYCKRFEDGTVCEVHAPADTDWKEIDELIKAGRREILKMKKSWIIKKAIFGFCVLAGTAFFIIRKIPRE